MTSRSRECGGCTACCGGTLLAKAKGHYIYPGKPCAFVAKDEGCTIHGDRPRLCRMFECAWLADATVPDALKPSESNLIITANPDPVAIPVHGRQVAGEHWAMYEQWLANR